MTFRWNRLTLPNPSILKEELASALSGEAYTAMTDGGEPPIVRCPECNERVSLIEEWRCVRTLREFDSGRGAFHFHRQTGIIQRLCLAVTQITTSRVALSLNGLVQAIP